MKTRTAIGVAALAAVLGGAGAWVAGALYWDQELQSQLAEKDRLLAELRSDADRLRGGLEGLQKTNTAMRSLIDASLHDAAEVARSNRTTLEKLRGIIARLEELQRAVSAPGGTP